jgi:hypothetical protein
MSPNLMRQFWSVVDGIRSNIPLALDDNSLEQWLLRELRTERPLNHCESDALSHYIHDRLPLIRAVAQDYQPAY